MNIEINGKEYYVKFNQYALEIYTKHLDWENETASAIYATAYAGLMGGAYVRSNELELTFEDITDWCDSQIQTDGKELIDLCNTWTDTFFYKKWLESVQDALRSVKKKVNR